MEYAIRAVAGSFVLLSLVLGYTLSPLWYLFTAFVGLNLLQSAFTRRCLMETILEKLGVARRPCPAEHADTRAAADAGRERGVGGQG